MSITLWVVLGLVALVLFGAKLAPTPSARVIPTGFKMPDGYQTTIAFSASTALQVWEVTVKPPGQDGGELINTTTMLNTKWRTFNPKHLITLSECTFTAAYDPDVWLVLLSSITNIPQTITIHLPDGSSIAFYGALLKAELPEHKEGEFPVATFTVGPTNWDPANNVEAGPTYTPASGT